MKPSVIGPCRKDYRRLHYLIFANHQKKPGLSGLHLTEIFPFNVAQPEKEKVITAMKIINFILFMITSPFL